MSDSHRYSLEQSETWIVNNKHRINDLADRSSWQNPYFSYDWLDCWWDRIEGLKKPVLLTVEDEDGKLVGLWPFLERSGLMKSKGLWPYVFDEANYFHPIAERSAVPTLVNGLKELLKKYTFIWIPLMRIEFWKEYLEDAVTEGSLSSIIRIPRETFLMESTVDDFDSFWNQKMGPKTRKSFRYDERALEELGKVVFERWESFEDILSMMPATCVVEVNSKKGKNGSGLYSIRGKRAFFFELLPRLAKEGKLRLSILRINDQAIAWQLDLLGKDYLAVHHLSFDENWKKYSPGRQLLRKNLQHGWEEGRTIDFLPLAFDYKKKLATKREDVYELHWFKSSLRGWIAYRLILWNMKLRQKIRQRASRSSNPDHPVHKALQGESV